MSRFIGPDVSLPPMSVRRLLAVRVYYGILAVGLTATLIAQCILTASEGRSLANTFSYFTIQSNVLVLVTSAILCLRPRPSGATWWRILRLAALVGITVTGIVYVLFLARSVHLTGLAAVYNQVFHHAAPLLTLVGFLVVEPRQGFRRRDLAFLGWPALWLVYTMVRGAFFDPRFTGFALKPSNYPYPFLDPTEAPPAEILGSIAFVFVLLLVVGVGYVFADRRKPFRRSERG
ncbi:Pr6Pr family membrane protein [Microbacterium sp. Leaf151]|uniref:Pr6Pr family membrane protein n=1 Tax=Microbacterium sp. Leaf151 TaxID=1736276 RepID=UPI0006FADCF7|nr:Pr6Pr family membrane protein [Microbacterium sp. Leaf151]KQR20995.1 hypothetical protein ASF76_11885 [Microbacterium sp. Leaf151]